jgi:acyl-CoA oxidase
MATVRLRNLLLMDDYGVNKLLFSCSFTIMRTGTTLEGITIGDCGHKMGQMRFHNGTISRR